MTFFNAFVAKADTTSRWVSRLLPNTWPEQPFQTFCSVDCLSISGALTQRDNHNQVSPHKQLASTSCILSPLNVFVRSSYWNLLNLTNTFVVKSLKRTEGLGVFKSETFRGCLWSDGQSAAPVPPEISHFLDELHGREHTQHSHLAWLAWLAQEALRFWGTFPAVAEITLEYLL